MLLLSQLLRAPRELLKAKKKGKEGKISKHARENHWKRRKKNHFQYKANRAKGKRILQIYLCGIKSAEKNDIFLNNNMSIKR